MFQVLANVQKAASRKDSKPLNIVNVMCPRDFHDAAVRAARNPNTIRRIGKGVSKVRVTVMTVTGDVLHTETVSL